MHTFVLIAALALAAALRPTPAWAGPGHDHAHDSAPAPSGPALPRFAAASELFELVGVLEGRRLTLYLDRASDNEPVSGARIELEIGPARAVATPRDDVYEVELPTAPPPGVLPVTATVTAGADIDLLAGELDLPADEAGAAHAHGLFGIDGPAGTAAMVGAVLVVLAALGLVGRRLAARRRHTPGANA